MKLSKEEITELSFIHPILFVDGECVLCDRAVLQISRWDTDKTLRFGLLQDYKAIIGYEKDAVLLIHRNRQYSGSDATNQIINILKLPKPVTWINGLINDKLKAKVYRLIAKNRFHLFGKKEECNLSLKNEVI